MQSYSLNFRVYTCIFFSFIIAFKTPEKIIEKSKINDRLIIDGLLEKTIDYYRNNKCVSVLSAMYKAVHMNDI